MFRTRRKMTWRELTCLSVGRSRSGKLGAQRVERNCSLFWPLHTQRPRSFSPRPEFEFNWILLASGERPVPHVDTSGKQRLVFVCWWLPFNLSNVTPPPSDLHGFWPLGIFIILLLLCSWGDSFGCMSTPMLLFGTALRSVWILDSAILRASEFCRESVSVSIICLGFEQEKSREKSFEKVLCCDDYCPSSVV